MWLGARVAVVVPAWCEERLIARTLRGMPGFVDHVIVIDDASPDRTSEVVRASGDPRVVLERHPVNRGVGASIVTGYRRALALEAQVIAVMAGDAQMDPADLSRVIEPVIRERADYVKGNRFRHPAASAMPLSRRVGGKLLSVLTRLGTGLDVDDTQCGYTAISASAVRRLPLDELWPRYGYPNDLLGLLAAQGLRVVEVPVLPVYADEASGVRPWHLATISALIVRRALANRAVAPALGDGRAPRAVPSV
jgi:glycosyltransferase involved in cell wall biosynthesis